MAAAHVPAGYVFPATAPIKSVYTFGKQLGQPGQFGCAHLVTHNQTGQVFACKSINKSAMLSGSNAAFYTTAMRNEVDILSRVTAHSHPNIIQFKEYFEDDTHLYLVMECAGGGELFDRIQAKGRYTEADACGVVRQMVLAVQHVHAMDIVHGAVECFFVLAFL
jgi:calcium-dependent protein kinase